MVDDCGTLIDLETRDTFDYVSDVCPLLNGFYEDDKRTYEIINKHIRYYEALMEQKGIETDKVHQRLLALKDLHDELLREKWRNIPKPEFKLQNCRCVYVPFKEDEKYD